MAGPVTDPASPDRSSVSVLCVDDDPDFADLIARFVERESDRLTTATATSASEGLDRLDDGAFDCVVSDYDMPGMDGLAFVRAVRDERPDLPFVLFTGRGSEELASDAISAGVTDYMRKDGGVEQYAVLARRVLNAVEGNRARRRATDARAGTRAVLDAAPYPALVSVEGTVVYANRSACDSFGAADPSELRGAEVAALSVREADDREPPAADTDDADGVTRRRRTLRTLDGVPFPAVVTRETIVWDGREATVTTVDGRPVREHDESARRDRTDRHARYRAAFDRAMDAIVVADEDLRYVDANRSACDLFGVSRDELLSRTVRDFAPDDYDFEGNWEEFRDDGSVRGTFPLVRPDGERRIVEYAATTGIVENEHLSVLRDVTERTRLEETLREERSALQRMYRVTADRESTFEEKLDELLGIVRGFLGVSCGFLTEIDGETQRIVTACGDHADIEAGDTCPISEAYCRKTITREELVTVQQAADEGWIGDPAYERWGLGCYVGAKIRVGDDIYGTICFAGTDPRESPFSGMERTFVELLARWASYELEERRATAELQRQNERLREFSEVVSHDLRSPLSVASGYLALARSEGTDEQFDRIESALDRMGRLVDDLLLLAREGETIGAVEPVDLRTAVESIWTAVDDGRRDAELRVEGDLGHVVADGDRLHQALANLFGNALEHGGPDVTVRVEPLAEGFAVEDDGRGLPADGRDRVFDRGFSTSDGGSGIGLHIVRKVVEAHGWTVAHVPTDRDGARFEVTGVSTTDGAPTDDSGADDAPTDGTTAASPTDGD
jgi:PAS domain S-box-containing protein